MFNNKKYYQILEIKEKEITLEMKVNLIKVKIVTKEEVINSDSNIRKLIQNGLLLKYFTSQTGKTS